MPALTTIVHLDADAFFASVEVARDPSLRGKPVAVGGLKRGIIASATYEARAFGVRTPMPTAQALRLCPKLILISGGYAHYREASQKLFALCETLTPLIERRSIDEGFFDLGPCSFTSQSALEKTVRSLSTRIQRELGITVSFGLASNKLVAAVASKLNKPAGFTIVPVGEESAFLSPLSVGVLPGIGTKTESVLRAQNIRTIAELLAAPEPLQRKVLGNACDAFLAMARGEDNSVLQLERDEAKSYSQQRTFESDVRDFSEIEREAKRMIDDLLPLIRADGKRARTLTIRVRYPGMEDASASHSLETASEIEADFYPHVSPLLRTAWKRRAPLRLVGVGFSGIEKPSQQLSLFADAENKRQRLAATIDALRKKQGSAAVIHGHQLPTKTRPELKHILPDPRSATQRSKP